MPPIIRPGDAFGIITSSVSDYFGFAKKIPVISGGPDFFAAILGSGVMEPFQACDRSGSSEGINLCTQQRIDDKKMMCYGHPVKPYWNLSGIINTTGKAIDWCGVILKVGDFGGFLALAQESGRGSGGVVFLPRLAGERAPVTQSSACGIWRGLNLSTGRAELANSVLEGIGFAVRDVLDTMEKSGAKATQLHVTGGLAANGYLNQLKADITGKQILQPIHKESELLGLAIIGCCFKGKFASYAEAIKKLVRIEKTYEPNFKNIELYNNLFQDYKNT
jgi:xylulokinase